MAVPDCRPHLSSLLVMTMKAAAVLVLAWSVSAHADDAAPVKALLADPAQLASWLRDRDPMMESARAKVEAAHANSEQARVLPNPQFSFATGGYVIGQTNADDGTSPDSKRPLSLADTTNFELGLTEMIELGKR